MRLRTGRKSSGASAAQPGEPNSWASFAGVWILRDAGCPWVLLDGSFVTVKAEPNDVDGCWQLEGEMDLERLDRCFLMRQPFIDKRAQKDLYGMDFYRASQIEAASGKPFPVFFQTDRSGDARGIVRLRLEVEFTPRGTKIDAGGRL